MPEYKGNLLWVIRDYADNVVGHIEAKTEHEAVKIARKEFPNFRNLRITAERSRNPYVGFKSLTKQLATKGARSPKALAAWIGRQKYGKATFQKAAARGMKLGNPSEPTGFKKGYTYYYVQIEGGSRGTGLDYLVGAYNYKAEADKAAKEIKKTGYTPIITKAKMRNPESTLDRAAEMSKAFHGREAEDIYDVMEDYKYPTNLTLLGELTEIEVLVDDSHVCPIEFKGVNLCCTPDGKQLMVVGGDQRLSLEDLGLQDDGRQYYDIGPCHSISYKTDKHHLMDSDGKVAEYIHEFGEEGGEQPNMVYDSLNKNILLTGGSYRVEEEGIKN